MERLKNKSAVIIGGTSGIGEEIAKRFAREGAKVMIGGIEDEKGATLAEHLTQDGLYATYRHADATKEEDMLHLMAEAKKQYGAPDISLSTVGGNKGFLLKDMPYETFQFLVSLNLFSAFLNIKCASPYMRGRGGVIINFSSLNSTVPSDYQGAYCASKAGVDRLSEVAALEMGPEGVRVVTINPGIIATALTEKFRSNSEALEEFMSQVPLRRVGHVEDVANLAVFLASDEASYITASHHYVDGGAAPEGYPDSFKMVMGTYKRPVNYKL